MQEAQPGKLVSAAQFKKKILKEVQDLVEDRFEARKFLANVKNIKNGR